MPDIRIFVVCHKPVPLPKTRPFVPIQVGDAPAIPGVEFRDNVGDNIARKNPNYCELTAQYWIWKNVKADYVGLVHYRRLPGFSSATDKTFRDFSDRTLRKFGWTERRIAALLRRYDVLLPPNWTVFPPGEPGHVMTPYEFHAYEHRQSDIDETLRIIRERDPAMMPFAKKALCEDRKECFGNVCVMRKDLFDSYSAWLFGVLFELERRIALPSNREEARLFGFLAERLIMVWIAYAKSCRSARIWFAPSLPLGDFGEELHPPLSLAPHAAVAHPMVSVVVPIYNVERYLPKCLNSVCGQCYDSIEVICVDDGSTDGSLAILQRAAAVDRRVRVIPGPHHGSGAARNLGVTVARGKYLAFVDGDDWVDRFIWFRSVRKAERDTLDMVLFEVERVDDETGRRTIDEFSTLDFLGKSYRSAFTWRDVPWNPLCSCCYPVNRLVRRDLWGDTRFQEGVKLGEDVLPHCRVALEARRIGALRVPYYSYRQRKGSSMTDRGRVALDHLAVVECVHAYLVNAGLMRDLAGPWLRFVVRMALNAIRYWPIGETRRRVCRWMDGCGALFNDMSPGEFKVFRFVLRHAPVWMLCRAKWLLSLRRQTEDSFHRVAMLVMRRLRHLLIVCGVSI